MESPFSVKSLQDAVGADRYRHLEKVASKEVAKAMEMPLIDKWRQEKYYYRQWKMDDLLDDLRIFNELGLTFTPFDVTNILFESQLLFASKSEKEFYQRAGGAHSFEEAPFVFLWAEKAHPIEHVIDQHLRRLEKTIFERTLVADIRNCEMSDFGFKDQKNAKDFFRIVISGLQQPFIALIDGDDIPAEHKDTTISPLPGLGFTATGTAHFVHIYGGAWLRAFFNVLRISGFIHHGQMNFGWSKVEIRAPSGPVFLGSSSMGGYSWEEDTKKPWEKIPDGCLFLSFGYRGLANMYLDQRTFTGIETFFKNGKVIFDNLTTPWSKRNLNDIEPALNILSSATQLPDLGAKLLLLYSCLEHLFVPKDIIAENDKYIIGAIHALKPELIDWYKKLYKLRSQYAHKGFILRDDKTMGIVLESIQNVYTLLITKLKTQG